MTYHTGICTSILQLIPLFSKSFLLIWTCKNEIFVNIIIYNKWEFVYSYLSLTKLVCVDYTCISEQDTWDP